MLCQTENPCKAEAAGTEAREGRSGPPGPAPPATAPLPQLAQRPGRAGPGRTPGAGGPRAGRGCGRRREQPQDGGSPAAALGAARVLRVPAAASAPGLSPALGSRLPWSTRAERAPAASGRSRGAPRGCRHLPAAGAAPRGAGGRAEPPLAPAARSPPVIGPSQRHLQLSGADSGAGSGQQPVPEPPTLIPTFRAVRAPRNKTPCFPRAIGSTDLASQ